MLFAEISVSQLHRFCNEPVLQLHLLSSLSVGQGSKGGEDSGSMQQLINKKYIPINVQRVGFQFFHSFLSSTLRFSSACSCLHSFNSPDISIFHFPSSSMSFPFHSSSMHWHLSLGPWSSIYNQSSFPFCSCSVNSRGAISGLQKSNA